MPDNAHHVMGLLVPDKLREQACYVFVTDTYGPVISKLQDLLANLFLMSTLIFLVSSVL